MQTITICPICEGETTLTADQITGIQLGRTYQIYDCQQCEASHAMPLGVDEAMYDLIYKNAAEITGYQRYLELSQNVLKAPNPMRFLSRSSDICQAVNSYFDSGEIRPDERILEVGCGLGYRTYSLAKRGYQVIGVEISPEAVQKAKALYGDYFIWGDVNEMALDPAHRYDVILLAEVIEHIPDVKRFIHSLYRMLNPSGRIILTTPNKSAYPKGVLWKTASPPLHLYWLTEKSMMAIGKQLKTTVSFHDFSAYNKYHLDISKLSPRNVQRDSFFAEDGSLLPATENPFHVKLAYFLLDKFPVLLNVVSFFLMLPYRGRENWNRRHFMAVKFTKSAEND